MRWQAQTIDAESTDDDGAHPDEPISPAALLPLSGLVRSVRTPEFAGITFHEVHSKSLLNKVPATSSMPFEWTINPYRGCSHACVYCFARNTHTYLDLDAGADFDSQVVVKVNAAEVLAAEVRRPSWKRPHVALGTNTDPYQRAEGRYKLMPGIIRALADSGTPFSILTKGTLLARDIPLLVETARQVPVGIGISLAMTNARMQSRIEPGTPSPAARVQLIRRLREAGLHCAVMAMPILPWLTDNDDALDDLLRELSDAGASGVTIGALHLRPGTREWWFQWLAREYPQLVGRYRRLYGKGSYAAKEYSVWLREAVAPLRRRHGLTESAQFFRQEDRRLVWPEDEHNSLSALNERTIAPKVRAHDEREVAQPALF